MSRDFDNFPTLDAVIKDKEFMSNIWADFMDTFVVSLREYLSQYGVFVPRLTLDQRNAIQSPQEGQLIYVYDAPVPTVPSSAHLQIWQVTSGTGQWTQIV